MKSFVILASFVVALLFVDKCIAQSSLDPFITNTDGGMLPAQSTVGTSSNQGGGGALSTAQGGGGGMSTAQGGGDGMSTAQGGGDGMSTAQGGGGGMSTTEGAGGNNSNDSSTPDGTSEGQSPPTTPSAASRQLSICSLVLASCVVLVKLL